MTTETTAKTEMAEKTPWQLFIEEIEPARKKHNIIAVGVTGLTLTAVEENKSRGDIHTAAIIPAFDDVNVIKGVAVDMAKAAANAFMAEAGRVTAISVAKALEAPAAEESAPVAQG